MPDLVTTNAEPLHVEWLIIVFVMSLDVASFTTPSILNHSRRYMATLALSRSNQIAIS